jgi:CheY-like chemotaxis protein
MPQPSYNVLVVDDNDSIHHDIRALLKSRAEEDDLDALAGELLDVRSSQRVEVPTYHLDSVYQGQDAVQAIQRGKEAGREYALALVDMRMPPGWNGVKTIQRIWEMDADVQVAICSAYSDYGWEELIEELGVSDKLLFLRKPFDPHALRQLVLSLTTRWHRERELRTLLRTHEHMLESYEIELRELRKQLAGEPVQDLLVQAAQRTAGSARRAASPETVGVALDALMDVLHALSATALSGEQRTKVAEAIRSGGVLRALLTTAPDLAVRH